MIIEKPTCRDQFVGKIEWSFFFLFVNHFFSFSICVYVVCNYLVVCGEIKVQLWRFERNVEGMIYVWVVDGVELSLLYFRHFGSQKFEQLICWSQTMMGNVIYLF